MVDVVRQLCIKSHTVKARNGDEFTAKQGKTYTTDVPQPGKSTVTVFSNFWVPVPKENFVPLEKS